MTERDAPDNKLAGYVGIPTCCGKHMRRQNAEGERPVYQCEGCGSEHYAPQALPPIDNRYDDSIAQRFRRW